MVSFTYESQRNRLNTGSGSDHKKQQQHQNMTLEKAIAKELNEIETYSVIAHELWGDGDGWSVNDSWYLSRNVDKAQVLEVARGRWEVFRANYSPRAKVKDLSFDGDDSVIYLNVDGIPFLEIRISNN